MHFGEYTYTKILFLFIWNSSIAKCPIFDLAMLLWLEVLFREDREWSPPNIWSLSIAQRKCRESQVAMSGNTMLMRELQGQRPEPGAWSAPKLSGRPVCRRGKIIIAKTPGFPGTEANMIMGTHFQNKEHHAVKLWSEYKLI